MKKLAVFFILILFCNSCMRKKTIPFGEDGADAPTFNAEIVRLSDINFPDQQYTINFILYIDYPDSTTGVPFVDYEHLIKIRNAKKKPQISFFYLGSDTVHHEMNLALDITAVMDKSWIVAGYPFDNQTVGIDIYLPEFDSSKLLFHTDKSPVLFQDLDNFESGWTPDTVQVGKTISFRPIDKGGKNHSIFSVQIPLNRDHPGFIFWKLFAGMYIAFFVSFVAFFINIHHVEPRFGLPVGGLFATIANKYIIEGLLPLTPKLSLVDWLHDITIFAIFLIIAFSAITLKLYDEKENEKDISTELKPKSFILNTGWKHKLAIWIDRINPWLFFSVYIAINIIIVLFNI